ncbi:MAG: DUF6671 family protein [Sphingobacterium thalpophilum]
MFRGRTLLIVTKHKKEKVIAPIIEKELGVNCVVTENFDTDILGTFTGETERLDDPIITARKKCLMAMDLNNCDLAIASEGSFGPHPTMFFIPADDELTLFIDKKNNLEIVARELSTETNFNGSEIKTEAELMEFAKNAKFPSHGLIIRKSSNDLEEIVKGITNKEQLKSTFNFLISKYGKCFIETDMRAMYNPTRLKVIEKSTKILADKINCLCPACKIPGFGITEAKQGLPCRECNFPTKSILSYSYSCQKCSFSQEEKYPQGKKTEDPMWCDFCNP